MGQLQHVEEIYTTVKEFQLICGICDNEGISFSYEKFWAYPRSYWFYQIVQNKFNERIDNNDEYNALNKCYSFKLS